MLWHYTCDHGRQGIGDHGLLLPGANLTERETPWMSGFVWLTDLARPQKLALGLTSYFTTCDRTRYRYRVTDETAVRRWVDVARGMPRAQRALLEESDGARPMHWWVANCPVPVVFDPLP